MPLTKETLLKMEEMWLSEENDTDEWYEEGLKLYKQLSYRDHFNFALYNKKQVDLLLGQARNEKLLHGNMHRAEGLLKRVIDVDPNHSEIYYRLAFINVHFKKWEAVLFYANEALEYGLSLDEEIKISALMGYSYSQIGLRRRGKEQFEHAEKLDDKEEWTLFIQKYRSLADERRILTKQQREEKNESFEIARQKTRENLCFILNLYSNQNCFITSEHEVSLNPKEAELLSFLSLNKDSVVSKAKILNNIWPELDSNSTVVKRNISSLRTKLSQAFDGVSGTDIIQFEKSGYKLSLPLPLQIFKGVNPRQSSCY